MTKKTPNYSNDPLPGINEFLDKTKLKLEELDDPIKNPKFWEMPIARQAAIDEVLNPEKFSSEKGLKGSFVDLNRPMRQQPIAVSYGRDWSGGPLCIFGQGDYSVITGISKSRKSFFKSAMIAAYIGMRDDDQWPYFKTHREPNKIVLDIDTEQSPYHAQLGFRRVEQLVGSRYERYFPFSWRKYDPLERLEMLEHLIEKYKDEIGLISIDGYIDLVEDYMDATEAIQLTQKLLTWTDKYKMHITGILHLNPNEAKMIGHMGSVFARKAGTVIKVKKGEEMESHLSKISHVAARDEEFRDFTMKIEQGIPLFNETVNF